MLNINKIKIKPTLETKTSKELDKERLIDKVDLFSHIGSVSFITIVLAAQPDKG